MGWAGAATVDNPHVQALNLTEDGIPLTYRIVKSGPDSALWEKEEAKELDKLIDETKTIHAIQPYEQPVDRRGDTTYYNPQPAEKMIEGVKTRRIRGVCGGDKVKYAGDVSARTAEMSEVKTMLNAVVSEGEQWMTLDIKDFYLGTPMERPEYMRIAVKMIPTETMEKYGLDKFVHDGMVLFQIDKGMYGLPQAGLLAQQRLVTHLGEHGYAQAPHNPCTFRHQERQTAFTLVVDDFGVKYRSKEDADHLIETLEKLYKVKVNLAGSKYLGYHIQFTDDRRQVSLSMPDYLPKVHQRFQARLAALDHRGAASPAVYSPPVYGSHSQMTEVDDSSPASEEQTKELQEIVGCFMYYARAVDGTMLPAVNHIASEMKAPTQRVLAMADRMLAYSLEYPNNELVFTASDMILYVQTDASYLSRSEARSVVGVVEYLGNKDQPTHINGAIHAVSSIIDVVVASAAEAEYAGVFTGARHAEGTRALLDFLGHPQPPTITLCDSACAVGIANDKVKIKRAKSIDMRFHWVRDRIRQGHFQVQWRKGAHNLADFYTKALPVHKHLELMPFLVHVPQNRHVGTTQRRARRAPK